MPVETIFCHGTQSSSADNEGNLIDILSKACVGPKLVLEGPGSKNFHRIGNGERARLPEALRKDLNLWKKKKPQAGGLIKARGLIAGFGQGSNTARAFLYIRQRARVYREGIEKLKRAKDKVRRIKKDKFVVNLIGWSRGGVTCFRIAYYLDKYYKLYLGYKPEINIFAIDPVEGGLESSKQKDHNPDRRLIPSCVKNLVVTLAMDDKRPYYVPSDHRRLTIPESINSCFLPFPGKHDTQVYRKLTPAQEKKFMEYYDAVGKTGAAANSKTDVLLGVSKLVWQMAYKFLKRQGTTLKFDRHGYDFTWQGNHYKNQAGDYLFGVSKERDSNRFRLKVYNTIFHNRDVYEHILRTDVDSKAHKDLLKRIGGSPTLVYHRRYIKKGGVWEIVKYPNLFVNDHHMYVYTQKKGSLDKLKPELRLHMKNGKTIKRAKLNPNEAIHHIRQGKYNSKNKIQWKNLF